MTAKQVFAASSLSRSSISPDRPLPQLDAGRPRETIRVLFWGGLIDVAASFVVPLPASIALFFATVELAVSLALLESWRTWRDDPDRNGGGPPGSLLRPATK